MSRAFALTMLALTARGCPQRAPPGDVPSGPGASSLPSASASAPPSPIAPVSLPGTTRVHGDVEGRFSVRRARIVAGEPVVVHLELRATRGPLTFAVGGDQRNMALFPTRVAVKAVDAAGAVVCDSVTRPAVMSFGGPMGERALVAGETLHQSFVLNPACPALSSAGDLHVTLHRRLMHVDLAPVTRGVAPPRVCDVFPVHEGPLPPSPLPEGYGPACERKMAEAPSVTTEIDLHVDPFDAAAVRAATRERLLEAGATTPKDEIGREAIAAWVCGWLVCGCNFSKPQGRIEDADVLGVLPTVLPPTFPGYCPRKR